MIVIPCNPAERQYRQHRVISICAAIKATADAARAALQCAKCGSTQHPQSARPGSSCTYGSACPVELTADNGAMCGGVLKARL